MSGNRWNKFVYFLAIVPVVFAVVFISVLPTNTKQASANGADGMSGITSLQVGLV